MAFFGAFLQRAWSRFKVIYDGIGEFFHVMAGIPSYRKYLEHHQKHHPNCKPKSYEEFFAEVQEDRFGKNGGKKCC